VLASAGKLSPAQLSTLPLVHLSTLRTRPEPGRL
jgi:hypothetical protein